MHQSIVDKTDIRKSSCRRKNEKTSDGEQLLQEANFARNKGKSLSCSPVRLLERFVRQLHPVFKGITIENNGIKCCSSKRNKSKMCILGVVSNIL